MNLYLVRHGETIENLNGVLTGHLHGSLTKTGIDQSVELAEELQKIQLARIYSSDLGRCKEMAKIIAKVLRINSITYTPKLREFNFGDLAGRKRVQVQNILDNFLEDLSLKTESSESILDLQKRLKNFITSVFKKYKNKNILFVTHSTTIKNIISIYTGYSIKILQPTIHMLNGKLISINLSSSNKGKIEVRDGLELDNQDIVL